MALGIAQDTRRHQEELWDLRGQSRRQEALIKGHEEETARLNAEITRLSEALTLSQSQTAEEARRADAMADENAQVIAFRDRIAALETQLQDSRALERETQRELEVYVRDSRHHFNEAEREIEEMRRDHEEEIKNYDEVNQKLISEVSQLRADAANRAEREAANAQRLEALQLGLVLSATEAQLLRDNNEGAIRDFLLGPNVHYCMRFLYGYYYVQGFSACRELLHNLMPEVDLRQFRVGEERFLESGETLLGMPAVDPVLDAPADFEPVALAVIYPDEVAPNELIFPPPPADDEDHGPEV